MSNRLALACAALLATCACLAADPGYIDVEKRLTPEQRHATGLDTLTPAQLELLNRLLREQPAASPVQAGTPAAPARDASPAAAAAPAAEATASKSAEPSREEGSLVGFNDAPIKSRLKTSIAGWEPGYVFELENGQKWKVLKGTAKLRTPLDRPPVEVVPGIAGRWFLQVTEDMPKARVYRID